MRVSWIAPLALSAAAFAGQALEAQILFPFGKEGEIYFCPRIDLIPVEEGGPLTVLLDGKLDDEVWLGADFQRFSNVSDQPRELNPPDLDTDILWAAVADEDYLYIAWQVVDDIRHSGENLGCTVWQDDSVEVYIDANNDGPDCLNDTSSCYQEDDAQITVGADQIGNADKDECKNSFLDPADCLRVGGVAGRGSCPFDSAGGPVPDIVRGMVRELELPGATGWQAEIAIALQTLGINDQGPFAWDILPTHCSTIGWNVQVNDDDDGADTREHKLMWSKAEVTESSWRNPGAFAKLIFIDTAGVLPEGSLGVENLSCERNSDGSVTVTWENPEAGAGGGDIRILVDGNLSMALGAGTTEQDLEPADVPLDGAEHTITVINSCSNRASCTVAGRLPSEPAELKALDGALYINCGSAGSVQDPAGRTWKPDELYLSPSQPPTGIAPTTQTIDQALLDDPDIPNQVLATERRCDCDIHYQMIVPGGAYRVILYFSENCRTCVSRDLGGSSINASAARIFDVAVEDQRVDGYNPADEAIPPGDDGIGAIFTATQLSFAAEVIDGALDIQVLDRGPGNPPENASIKAISIQRAPDAPAGLTAAAPDGEKRVILDWNDAAPAGPPVAGYNVYRAIKDAGPFERVNAGLVAESRYVDADLGAGGNGEITFCYAVAAVSPSGVEGPRSAEACAVVPIGGGVPFKRGDTDANGSLEITDPINLLGFLFLGEAKPPCFDAADADDNGALEITDAIAILGFMFLGEAAPPAPGPLSCGQDPTEEAPGADFGCQYPAVSCQ